MFKDTLITKFENASAHGIPPGANVVVVRTTLHTSSGQVHALSTMPTDSAVDACFAMVQHHMNSLVDTVRQLKYHGLSEIKRLEGVKAEWSNG